MRPIASCCSPSLSMTSPGCTSNDWVYGDLSFKNAAFAIRPPRMILLDCDGAADLGRPAP